MKIHKFLIGLYLVIATVLLLGLGYEKLVEYRLKHLFPGETKVKGSKIIFYKDPTTDFEFFWIGENKIVFRPCEYNQKYKLEKCISLLDYEELKKLLLNADKKM